MGICKTFMLYSKGNLDFCEM